MMDHPLYTGHACPALLDYLMRRRSAKLVHLHDPGPEAREIETIINAAARVPDHGKLCPWRFVVFTGKARARFGQSVLREAYQLEDAQAAPAKLDFESERLMRAPCVIAVISTPKESKHPVWEQHLSAGAAAYNLCLAANALGYGTTWLSEWMAYNAQVRTALGLRDHDQIARFVYIGTPTQATEERPRPALNDILRYWE